jgi:hypothetical protein
VDEFFKILGGGTPLAWLIIVVILLIVITIFAGLFFVLLQGRSLSFYGLKIGKPRDKLLSKPIDPRLADGAEVSFKEEPPPSVQKLIDFLGLPRTHAQVGIFVAPKECLHVPDRGKPYKVFTVSNAHMQVAAEIVHWLGRIGSIDFEPQDLFLSENNVGAFPGSTLFYIGGPLANEGVRDLVPVIESGNRATIPGQIEEKVIYVHDRGHEIELVCRGVAPNTFVIRPAREERTIRQVEDEVTYGCIMKVAKEDRTTFAVWGLDARGTRGAARWLVKHWEKMQGERVAITIVRLQPRFTLAADCVKSHRSERGVLVPEDVTYLHGT